MRIIAKFYDYMKGRDGSIIIETGDDQEVMIRRGANDPLHVHISVGICKYTIQDYKISRSLEEEQTVLITRNKNDLKAFGPELKKETMLKSGSVMEFGATKFTFFF